MEWSIDMNKYIIKNCPAITDGRNIENICIKSNACCEMITDCLLKQIVKTCKEVIKYNVIDLGMSVMASDVLRLLEIQEN